MKQFSVSLIGKTKEQVLATLPGMQAPTLIKALIEETMEPTAMDAIVNVSMSGYEGSAGITLHGSVHLPPPGLKPEDIASAFDLNPQIT